MRNWFPSETKKLENDKHSDIDVVLETGQGCGTSKSSTS